MAIGTSMAILMAAGMAAGSGAINSRSKKSTSTTERTNTYTPEQMELQKMLAGSIAKRAQPRDFTPQKTAAIGGVNRTFKGAETRLDKSLTSRGMGSSGGYASGGKDIEIARAGAIGGLESDFADMQMRDDDRGLDLASRFAFANPGSSSTTEGTSPGNSFGAGLGSSLETAMFLYGLDQMNGGGSGSGPSSSPFQPGEWGGGGN